jgi:hypothetical protein
MTQQSRTALATAHVAIHAIAQHPQPAAIDQLQGCVSQAGQGKQASIFGESEADRLYIYYC